MEGRHLYIVYDGGQWVSRPKKKKKEKKKVRKSKRKLIETHSSIVVKLILLRLMGKRGLPHPRTLLQIWKNIMMSGSVETGECHDVPKCNQLSLSSFENLLDLGHG